MTYTFQKVLLQAAALASARAFVCNEYVKVRIQRQLQVDDTICALSWTWGCLASVHNSL